MNTTLRGLPPVDSSHTRGETVEALYGSSETNGHNQPSTERSRQLASPPDSDAEDPDDEAKVDKNTNKKLSTHAESGENSCEDGVNLVDRPFKRVSGNLGSPRLSYPLFPVPVNGNMVQTIDGATAELGNNGSESESTLGREKVLKLSSDQLRELTSSPDSLPVRPLLPEPGPKKGAELMITDSETQGHLSKLPDACEPTSKARIAKLDNAFGEDRRRSRNLTIQTNGHSTENSSSSSQQPGLLLRALSTPASVRSPVSPQNPDNSRTISTTVEHSKPESSKLKAQPTSARALPSPMPQSFPLPPLSMPTYLQLELASTRPSQLYIHRSTHSDFPYESSRVKIDRLLNFLLLPPHLEGVLWFGTLACVDAWLYTFTILPLRLLKSIYILGHSLSLKLLAEVHFISHFVYNGTGRMWQRRRTRGLSASIRKVSGPDKPEARPAVGSSVRKPARATKNHKRTKSVPSTLLPDDKADILKSLLIICTSLILLRFDASRMYHWIRVQSAIKLYVIYNLLEVCDRLFSAIGQDVLECLFSREALERKPDGHSKVLRPFWLFMLALTYTVIHSTALFYQVITLNVAVNSYSNALITLLMSNQFVEIKSTVFKKFEKENLFQLTCADIVERFQLWHMLIIIASRNIVETGGLTKGFSALASSSPTQSASQVTNSSIPFTQAVPPLGVSSILPRSFTLLPNVVNSLTSYVPAVSHVLGPFFVVLGSEMLVDWLKHAYINKFNNTRPAIYGRFLDVLAKDYYTNAFGDQNLTKRLGLPVIPLSCVLIRASVQTYQIFMAVWVPSVPPSSSTSLTSIHETYAPPPDTVPASIASKLSRMVDEVFRGIPTTIATSQVANYFVPVLILLLGFLVLLACKLVLGMLLLSFARSRYRSMKEREKESIYHVDGGRRVGGWGVVEVDEDKRRWIYEDDPAGMQALRDREEKERAKREKDKDKTIGVESFEKVKRYEMVAKRIW